MTAQSPSAYLLSATIHAAVVALAFTAAWVVQKQVREPAKIIELVAGEGDNWAATEAPALGSPTGSEDVKVPNIPVPMPKISDPEPMPATPPAPEPMPEKPVPIEKAPPEKVEPEKAPIEKAPPEKAAKDAVKPSQLDTKRTTYAQDVKRIADKRYKRLMDKYHKEQAAAEAAERRRMTKEEFDKAYKAGKAGTGGGGIKRVDAKGIAGGVVGGSTSNTKGGAGGKALSVAEQNLLDQYFAYFKHRFKAVHEPPAGVGDKLTAMVEFMVAADGSISQVHISQGSGNADFDRSILDAFKRMKSIGARPDGRSDMVELEVNAKDDD